ncbi:SOS response-associated peptidase [Psychroflexus sp. YR1-1]|uniref:Abasic site processing protein n=1 Tax=Psychroflexus aurantiacus TaxID=2709310 RepID=A0A6B3R1S5_9FLAO|nr:SOS response-associated peptidase family protein [Psychroflexus aurantiacus]NEV93998.1 SOS response-associated peptidase [Psychroflexus aurantiacus]
MCAHTSVIQNVKNIEAEYKVKLSDESKRDLFDEPHYHIIGFTHPQMLIIPQEKPGVLAASTWGIAPEDKLVEELKTYYKAARNFGGGINARSEKAFDHFLYRESIYTKRCIIPVSAFFEPHDHKGDKYPFVFKPKDKDFLSLAGIYTRIDRKVTFAILTKEASPLFAKIHNKKNRQPVILSSDQENDWLKDDLDQREIEGIIRADYDESQLEYHPVSQDLFHPHTSSDVKDILKKVEYEVLEVDY